MKTLEELATACNNLVKAHPAKRVDVVEIYQMAEEEAGETSEAHAAKLERERDEAIRLRDADLGALRVIIEKGRKMERERDSVIAAIEIKRDEAIKELRHLADLLDAHFERGGTVAGIGTTNKARQILSLENVERIHGGADAPNPNKTPPAVG